MTYSVLIHISERRRKNYTDGIGIIFPAKTEDDKQEPRKNDSERLMHTDWQHFEHGADIGIWGRGVTLEDAYTQAALALTAVITDPDTVAPETMIELDCEAPDHELLFVDWLNALVYEMASRRMLFSRFEVQIQGNRLHAQAWGEPINLQKHRPTVEVKGATYTALQVYEDEDGTWHARTVVDV